MSAEPVQNAAQGAAPVLQERKRWLFLALPFTFTVYRLDDKKLQLQRGLFTTTEDDILLFRIMDVSVRRNLFQKMAGLGTMTVISSDKTNPSLEIKNIKNVHAFKVALDDRVEKERMRMRFKAGEFIDTEFDQDITAN